MGSEMCIRDRDYSVLTTALKTCSLHLRATPNMWRRTLAGNPGGRPRCMLLNAMGKQFQLKPQPHTELRENSPEYSMGYKCSRTFRVFGGIGYIVERMDLCFVILMLV